MDLDWHEFTLNHDLQPVDDVLSHLESTNFKLISFPIVMKRRILELESYQAEIYLENDWLEELLQLVPLITTRLDLLKTCDFANYFNNMLLCITSQPYNNYKFDVIIRNYCTYTKIQLDTKNEVDVPESSENSKTHHWDDKDTLCLMDLCMMYREKLQSPKYKKKHIFKEISDVLLEKGHQFSPLQCEDKLKTLITKYREICDHNNKTGNERKTWKFFEQLEEYIGVKPNVRPAGKCSFLGLAISSPYTSSVTGTDVQKCMENNEGEPPAKKMRGKTSRKVTPRNELLKWLGEYEKKNEKKEEERREILERHHRETSNILKEILNEVTKQ
ncbi:hypothetical protein JTB14_036013 [Gonioctena quinquepunctata]|nr:hypothetical protein JTB14_036013 [Gonioctena quinquepunctata]